jgi:hypothetical protein
LRKEERKISLLLKEGQETTLGPDHKEFPSAGGETGLRKSHSRFPEAYQRLDHDKGFPLPAKRCGVTSNSNPLLW